MKARQSDKKSGARKPRVYRWLLPGVATLAMIFFAAMTTFGWVLWQRQKAIVDFARETRDRYIEINRRHAFASPPPGARPDPARVEAYYRIRSSLTRTIDPRSEELADRLLDDYSLNERGGNLRLLQVIWQLLPFLEAASDAHLGPLEREGMSLNEFVWIHGLIVRDVLAAGDSDPRGEQLRSVLARLERFGVDPVRSDSEAAESYLAGIRNYYQKWDTLPGEFTDRYDADATLVSLMDLLAANQSLWESLGPA